MGKRTRKRKSSSWWDFLPFFRGVSKGRPSSAQEETIPSAESFRMKPCRHRCHVDPVHDSGFPAHYTRVITKDPRWRCVRPRLPYPDTAMALLDPGFDWNASLHFQMMV